MVDFEICNWQLKLSPALALALALDLDPCHLRGLSKAWFPLIQLRPQRPISRKYKAISVKDDCFVFVSWSWHLPCNGNQAYERHGQLGKRHARHCSRNEESFLLSTFLNFSFVFEWETALNSAVSHESK